MIIYKSRFLARAEVWFDDEATESAEIDWILYRQRSGPVRGAKSRIFHNRLIDLSKSEKQLAAELNEETAYKIRRARDRDGIVCEWHDARDPAVMDRFEQMHKLFAMKKGLPGLNRPRLESLAAAGALDLSSAKDTHGSTLVYHAYYRDCRRASQLESPSVYRTFSDSSTRNFCGRANRYLTWTNILRFKAQGLTSFDFGGWYVGSDPELRFLGCGRQSGSYSVLSRFTQSRHVTLPSNRKRCPANPGRDLATAHSRGARPGIPVGGR